MEYLLLLIGFVLLIKGADFFVDGSSSLARIMKVPSVIIGLTIVAMGTSMPEAAVSITAAMQQNAGITIGNVVGSNIFNTLMIVGCTALFAPIVISQNTLRKEIPLCILSSIVLLICANDVLLDSDTQQIIIITGPNMAGKSALLRQTALITLLAQIGSFVPAESAHIGLVDKIFTRVGASDNISVGESTFMVEMNEAADILNNVSSRSLVLFDELGRGTSTYDGISIAWAIVEYIHEHPKAKARTLFATHYHELNEMEKSFKRIKNYNVSVKEVDNKVIFLRKLERGGSEHSFGIHVAKMAGMPKSIVKRANEILKQLESDNRQQGIAGKPLAEVSENRGGMQLSFFQLDDPILCQIRDEILNLDVNNLTPIEALNKLNDIKKIVRGK